jgi:methylaspartate ammonia-lyase
MFPQSAIQTAAECERLPEYVSWIVRRVRDLAGDGYTPDLHFDFHASLGRMLGNDEDKVCEYLADIVRRAAPYRVYFEDPMLSSTADEARERMARLRRRFDSRGPDCGLIADEWANAPGEMQRFAAGGAAHAIQIKVPDNGSLATTIEAMRICREHGVLPYLGGSCNETDISARATVHVGIAFGAWRLFTKPGMGFDEGLMVMTNEMNRTLARL